MKNGKMSQWTLIAPISMEDGRSAASLPPSLPPVSEELCSTSQFGTLEGPSHSPLPAAQLAARSSLPLSLPLIYQPSPHAPPAFPFLPPSPLSLHSLLQPGREMGMGTCQGKSAREVAWVRSHRTQPRGRFFFDILHRLEDGRRSDGRRDLLPGCRR